MRNLHSLILLIPLVSGFIYACSNPQTEQTTELSPPISLERPNILMITCEDISPYLGSYGDTAAITPILDNLASQGVRYTGMFSVSGVCAPSRSALATGMYPTSIGTHNMRTQYNTLVDDLKPYAVVLPEGVRHYAEIMRENGYYVTNNAKTDYQFDGPITAWDEVSNEAGYHGRKKDQPFFAIYNSVVTHESQVWRKSNDSLLSDPESVPIPPYYPSDNPIIKKDVARVYSNVTEMDQWVGNLLAELEEDGLLENTIVIFYSDHGGPLPRQKRELYDSGLRVPFIVRYPDLKWAGTVNNELHSFVDIPPSVLSLAGIPVPEYMQGRAFLGDQASQQARKYIYAARDRMDSEYDRVRAVRDKEFKYLKNYFPEKPYIQKIDYRLQMDMMNELIRLNKSGELNEQQSLWFREEKPEEELYDLKNDPYELRNLANTPDYQNKLAELRQALTNWQNRYGDLGAVEEKELVSQMWNGNDEPPSTANSVVNYDDRDGLVTISCPTPSASIGYQFMDGEDMGSWNIYSAPFKVKPGQKLKVLAQRIGFQRSDTILFNVPVN